MSVIAHFSCGAASAIATKLALAEYPETAIMYLDTGGEHPDNKRFLADCQSWFGREITVVKSDKYSDPWAVWETKKYIAGVNGAPCTSELKRIPGDNWMYTNFDGIPTEVFGYTVEESHRVKRFADNNPERKIWPILIERGLTKGDCLAMMERAGISLPVLYLQGYRNNNCVGCPKGGMGYWNKIRIDYPEVFERMASLERKLSHAINSKEKWENDKRKKIPVFLDELDPDAGNYQAEPSISCGLMCEIELQNLNGLA